MIMQGALAPAFLCAHVTEGVKKLTNPELCGVPGLNDKLAVWTILILFSLNKSCIIHVVRLPDHKQNSSTH